MRQLLLFCFLLLTQNSLFSPAPEKFFPRLLHFIFESGRIQENTQKRFGDLTSEFLNGFSIHLPYLREKAQ